jgi:hypothetical protein
MERYDEEVEKALIFGQDPAERLADLTRLQPVKEGSRITNDPLQVALAQHYNEQQREIAHAVAVEQERKAYALVKAIEQSLADATDHWNECQTRMHATAPRN